MKSWTRDILPDRYLSDEEEHRFLHRDIQNLSTSQIWAEIAELERWLARQIFLRAHSRIFDCTDAIVTDQGWVRHRVRLLRAALDKRMKGAA